MTTWDDIRNTPQENRWQSLYNVGVGSNSINTTQVPSVSSGVVDKVKQVGSKLFGPAMSALSLGTEPLADALIRKGGTFKERFKSALNTGGDIGGALETRGMPALPASMLGFAGSLALPGLGEVKQVQKFGDVANALRKLKPTDRWISAMKLLNIAEPAVAGEATSELTKLAKDFLGPEKFNKMIKSKKYGLTKTLDFVDQHLDEGFNFSDELSEEAMDIPNILKRGKSIMTSNGKTFYHGTKANFNKFDDAKLGSNTEWLNSKWGHFFSEDKNIAKRFLNEDSVQVKDTRTGRIIEAELDLKKPLDFTPEGLTTNKEQAQIIYEAMTGEKISPNKALEYIKDAYEEASGMGGTSDFYDEIYSNLKIKELAQKKGYDGIISHYGELDGKNIKEYGVFSANQIKIKPSPIKTVGDFNIEPFIKKK